jgi:hypothetical protein
MPADLKLIVDHEDRNLKKRVFPHFPLNYLTFKVRPRDSKLVSHAYEVNFLSFDGMQLSIKLGKNLFKEGDQVVGSLNWWGELLEIEGNVRWVRGHHLGVKFHSKCQDELKQFVGLEKVLLKMRKVDLNDEFLKVPQDLSLWLRSDGIFDLYTWKNTDGSYRRVHLSYMQQVLEWENQQGLTTGKIFSKRDIETPLWQEHEYYLQVDHQLNPNTHEFFQRFIENLPEDSVPSDLASLLKHRFAS